MANAFDQFDAQSTAPASTVGAGNPFDQFDAPTSSPQPSFLQKIGQDFSKGKNTLAQEPDTDNIASQLLQAAGAGLGVVKDVSGDIGSKVQQGVAAIVRANNPVINDMANSAIGAVSSAVSPIAHAVENSYNNVLPQGTEARRNVDALGNIVGGTLAGATTAEGAGSALNIAKDAISTGGLALSDVAGAVKSNAAVPTSKGLFEEGDKAYADANAAGAGGHPIAVNNFLSQANKTAGQDPILMQVHGPDAAQTYLNNLNNLKNTALPLDSAQSLDIDLREKAAQAFRAGDNDMGARYKSMQQSLRDNIYNQPDPSLITGGQQGFQALQEGNRLYSAGYKAENVENGIGKGMQQEVQQTGIKNQFKNMYANILKNGQGGWTDEQVAAIKAAGETGALTGFLKNMGSKLVGPAVGGTVGGVAGSMGGPIGAALGGTAGSAAGFVGGAPFRAAATAIQKGKANNILRLVTDDPKYNPIPIADAAPAAAAPLMISGPDAARPMTAAQIAAAQQSLKETAAAARPETGGLPVDKPQTGPMVGRPDGDVPYNYYSPDAPPRVLALPPPSTEMAVTPGGRAIPLSAEQKAANDAARNAAANVGMTPDVAANINRLNIRQKFGPAFDALDQASQNKIAAQVDKMWQQNPRANLSDLIKSGQQMAELISHETGYAPPSGTMAQALAQALNKKVK